MPESFAAPSAELVDEFNAQPFGIHSPNLQTLLHELRSAPMPGKHFLLVVEPGKTWALAQFSKELPLRPVIDWTTTFDDVEDAERHVFAERLRSRFGKP